MCVPEGGRGRENIKTVAWSIIIYSRQCTPHTHTHPPVHNLTKTLSLVRDRGTISGTISVEFNDLCFELTEQEREAIGGSALNTNTSTATPTAESTANHTPNEVGGASVATVSGITNQMEGLNVDRLPERPEGSPAPQVEQETQNQMRNLETAVAVGGGASLLVTGSRVPLPQTSTAAAAPTPASVSVRVCLCVGGGGGGGCG